MACNSAGQNSPQDRREELEVTTAVPTIRLLTKNELADALGVQEQQIRKWRSDDVLPASWTIEHHFDSHETAYRAVSVALGELVLGLRNIFGGNSPVPNASAVTLRPTVERLFRAVLDGHTIPASFQMELAAAPGEQGILLTIPTTFLHRAKAKLVKLAAQKSQRFPQPEQSQPQLQHQPA
jgi:hypothetical protein